MNNKIFIDTGILLHLFSSDEPEKQEQVINILDNDARHVVISEQVVYEFAAALLRIYDCNLSFEEIKMETECIISLADDVVNGTPDLTLQTLETHATLFDGYGYSFFDSKIITAAIFDGCKILLSEDFEHGQIIGDLKIINPFVDINIDEEE